MKWALVLALVLCCGSTRGETEYESVESLDKLTEQLKQEFLFRPRNLLADTECVTKICDDNEECYVDEGGEKCRCAENFAKKGEKCVACDCLGDGICTFNGDDMQCACANKFAQKSDGKCYACDCLGDGICTFNGDDMQCACEGKFAKKSDGKCYACDCLGDGICTFNGDDMQCTCAKKFAKKSDGKCYACDCLGDGVCTFDGDDMQCACAKKFAVKSDGKCYGCDCLGDGVCTFSGDEIQCACEGKFAKKSDGKCYACDCKGKGTCSFDDANATKCDCDKGFVKKKDGLCYSCDCGEFGECVFVNDVKKCKCDDNYAEEKGICREKCLSDADCGHETKCSKGTKESGLFCDCGIGSPFTGDKCEKVKECETGDLKNCEESGGDCIYSIKDSKAECKCEGEIVFDTKSNICRKKCDEKDAEYCKNGAKCDAGFCGCLPGTSGDDCSTVKGCDTTLTEKCETISAKCIYDINAKTATCECDNKDLMYKDNKCTAKWCESKPCAATDSVCVYGFGSAFCKCKKVGQYYNYASNKCIDISKCPLVPCKTNEYCKDDGICACGENFVKDKDVCKDERKKLCESKPCYAKANCTEGGDIGTVKCECPSDTYFDWTSKTCKDTTCFLNDKREKCKAVCPDAKLKREENGECVVKEEKDKCKDKRDCGPFGYCLQVGETSKCFCIKDFAVPNKEGVCILNKDKYCPSKQTQSNDPNKCKCSENHKVSSNGITCEIMTCGDEAAKNDCRGKGAICVDTISNKLRTGYECKCPAGQTLVGQTNNKRCVDVCSDEESIIKCSKNQQTCYLDEKGVGTCKCPPGFTEIKTVVGNDQKITCQPSAAFSYLLKQLPVMSSEFLNEDKTVNKVKLNKYVIESMKAVSSKNFEFGLVQNYRTSDDVLLCDVWLNFNKDAEQDVKRWRSQIVLQDGSILPPSLRLSSDKLDGVKYEKLSFCSEIVKQTACGQGSTCDKNACTCEDGYRVIGPTFQVIGENTVLRCEDVDECLENKDICKANSKCTNTIGGYLCQCNPGFHKKNQNESEECVELCSPSPCNDGDCKVKENKVECSCKVGFKGSYCTESDDKLKQAQHSTKVVGAVLGTILAVTFVAIIAYIVKLKKNSYSEDFSSSPRDNAEMAERRGVSNRGYQ